MSRTAKHLTFFVTFMGIAALTAIGLWKCLGEDPMLVRDTRTRDAVMGTVAETTVVVRADQSHLIDKAHTAAARAMRDVEARMSVHFDHSELAALNAAPAGQFVPLSSETLDLLRRSRELTQRTDGAFDPTAKPLLDLWRHAAEDGRVPTDEEIRLAQEAVGWEHFDLSPQDGPGVVKYNDSAQIDLGGIAKGHAADKAVKAIRHVGCRGGLINIGGDMRTFGQSTTGQWVIGVQDPFRPDSPEPLLRLGFNDAAVCTSGHYHRYFEIDGTRYSHIIDPETGWPVDVAASVTVVAEDSATADAWSTALSVLGTAGLPLAESQDALEALVVVGNEHDHRLYMTTGFNAFIIDSQDNHSDERTIAAEWRRPPTIGTVTP